MTYTLQCGRGIFNRTTVAQTPKIGMSVYLQNTQLLYYYYGYYFFRGDDSNMTPYTSNRQ